MHVHFLIHEYFEAPGAYEDWAKNKHYQISYTRIYQGDPLPRVLDDIDFLIVMGGPQSPSTSQKVCAYFDAKAEQRLINQAIDAGKAVIGVCLGAQLVGEALGAAFAHSPEKEIGKFPITLTPAGQVHPLFTHFGQTLSVGHWHNDMPGLTSKAEVIAYSDGCPRQIVGYGPLVYGFQCHLELTPSIVDDLIENSMAEFKLPIRHRFVQTPNQLRQHDYRTMNQQLHQFLDRLQQRYQERLTQLAIN